MIHSHGIDITIFSSMWQPYDVSTPLAPEWYRAIICYSGSRTWI